MRRASPRQMSSVRRTSQPNNSAVRLMRALMLSFSRMTPATRLTRARASCRCACPCRGLGASRAPLARNHGTRPIEHSLHAEPHIGLPQQFDHDPIDRAVGAGLGRIVAHPDPVTGHLDRRDRRDCQFGCTSIVDRLCEDHGRALLDDELTASVLAEDAPAHCGHFEAARLRHHSAWGARAGESNSNSVVAFVGAASWVSRHRPDLAVNLVSRIRSEAVARKVCSPAYGLRRVCGLPHSVDHRESSEGISERRRASNLCHAFAWQHHLLSDRSEALSSPLSGGSDAALGHDRESDKEPMAAHLVFQRFNQSVSSSVVCGVWFSWPKHRLPRVKAQKARVQNFALQRAKSCTKFFLSSCFYERFGPTIEQRITAGSQANHCGQRNTNSPAACRTSKMPSLSCAANTASIFSSTSWVKRNRNGGAGSSRPAAWATCVGNSANSSAALRSSNLLSIDDRRVA